MSVRTGNASGNAAILTPTPSALVTPDKTDSSFANLALPGHLSTRHEILRADVAQRIKKPCSYFQDRLIQHFANSKHILHTARGPNFIVVISDNEEAQARHTAFIQQLRKELTPTDTKLTRVLVGNCSALNKSQLAALLSDYGSLQSLEMTNSLNTSAEYGEAACATLLRRFDAKPIPRQIPITALGCKWDVAVSIVRSSHHAETTSSNSNAQSNRDRRRDGYSQQPSEEGKTADGTTTLCRDFSRGLCSRKICKFLHVAAPQETKQVVCRNFNRGHCNRDPCGFAHVHLDPQLRPLSVDSTRGKTVDGHSPTRPTKVCRNFQLPGSCSRNPCRFLHVLLPPGNENPEPVTSNAFAVLAALAEENEHGAGEEAALATEDVLAENFTADSPPTVCRLFQQAGSCNSEPCRFLHVLLPAGEDPVLGADEASDATAAAEKVMEEEAEEGERLPCPDIESLTLTAPSSTRDDNTVDWSCDMCDGDVPP